MNFYRIIQSNPLFHYVLKRFSFQIQWDSKVKQLAGVASWHLSTSPFRLHFHMRVSITLIVYSNGSSTGATASLTTCLKIPTWPKTAAGWAAVFNYAAGSSHMLCVAIVIALHHYRIWYVVSRGVIVCASDQGIQGGTKDTEELRYTSVSNDNSYAFTIWPAFSVSAARSLQSVFTLLLYNYLLTRRDFQYLKVILGECHALGFEVVLLKALLTSLFPVNFLFSSAIDIMARPLSFIPDSLDPRID
ncbi:hypothetical protein M422DRAFT_55823 [Sphaerobolus stellatus SS14]|uniref:Uncharacterized protein n=1 Tax=Sphaerobolus stellatus (strain SS14) TaxID=990650 RepID=A0A0C9UKK0_SPHS4|nr:hypothetical protein M422DRAFT_55823 [Sphaerobolus stellatus SS14]